jgi:altronate dehydratase small subunit
MVRGFLIKEIDSVLTLLDSGKIGDKLTIVGKSVDLDVELKEEVNEGHKVACRDIKAGEAVLKYGVAIGFALRDIKLGQWVHFHNIQSNFDKQTGPINLKTGAPLDRNYE